ncbi:hypothetical protein [Burkholderia ubonensis]|uniref:hypothetical protein n=1 Tax=Burkholderia ubonensis TaxID=101571 RepID=UPI0009B455E2|nr:hypothetical protein [Burkholderia ubonensis]
MKEFSPEIGKLDASGVRGASDAALGNHHPLGDALSVMMEIMDLINGQMNGQLNKMRGNTNESRDMQDKANLVESQAISKLNEPKDTIELPRVVIDYMRENKVLVHDMSIDAFLSKGTKLDKADLLSIKQALETRSGRASDFVQQSQLDVQRRMTGYNTAVTMSQSIQSMLAESCKSIAGAIR